MATKKQIIDSIYESLYQYRIPDDHDIDEDFIAKKIDDVNAVLIDEHYKQGLSLDGFYQEMCCITVACRKQSCDVEGTTVYSGDLVWYAELPDLNHKIGWRNIKFLGKPGYGVEYIDDGFTRVSLSGFMSAKHRNWTGDKVFYHLVGNEARFVNLPTSGIKKICLIGILDTPISACDWDDSTSQYPTPDVYKLELRVKQDILATYGLSKDEMQDARDTTGNQAVNMGKSNPLKQSDKQQ